MDSLKRISILLELKYNKNSIQELKILKEETDKEYKKLSNKDKYLENIAKEKQNTLKRIEEIKDTLDDDEKIKKEYARRNRSLPLDKKIFSVRVLLKILIDEKKDCIEKLKEYEELEKEENYNENLKRLEEKLRYLRLVNVEDRQDMINDLLLVMQKIFLQGMNGSINNANSKDDIIDLIYMFRYYCMLPYDDEKQVYEIEKLKEDIYSVGRFLLNKANALKIINIFSNSEDLNYEILQKIYMTRIISLEELNMKITKEKEKYYVQLFDENIFDEKIEIKSNRKINKKDIEVKLNKKVKLFI